jgi:hypothetical protein
MTKIKTVVPSKENNLFDEDGMLPSEEKIDHPTHYQSYNTSLQIECIDAMRAAFGDEAVAIFCKLNAFKYLWRESSKQGNISIKKAIWYLNKYLELNK